jgi:hypothetical protein
MAVNVHCKGYTTMPQCFTDYLCLHLVCHKLSKQTFSDPVNLSITTNYLLAHATNSFIRRSKTLLSRRTRRPHVRHLMPISASNLTTRHSWPPQGCAFFRRTISLSFTSATMPDLLQYNGAEIYPLISSLNLLATEWATIA